jgi:NAD(P)-dependent dehydrogenase (short-subunit alcohol dehydrogenase family)
MGGTADGRVEPLMGNEPPGSVRARVETPFGAHSTAAEVIAGVDLTGRRALVTGGASGIGLETARALAGAGAEVTLAVRDTRAGERAAAEIAGGIADVGDTAGANPQGTEAEIAAGASAVAGRRAVRVAQLDLLDRASIAAFVASWEGPLQILVNNAGIMALPELERTSEGWEKQFATNHLGHFALALGLREALAAGAPARIVSVSSTAHLGSPVHFEDIHFRARPYEPLLAYGQSKTANVLFAVEATARWAREGILANALMPGAIATRLQRHMDPDYLARARARSGGTLIAKTPAQGAATSTLLAASPLLEGVGGRYFEDCNEAAPATPDAGPLKGVAPYALDPQNARRLWEESLRLLA